MSKGKLRQHTAQRRNWAKAGIMGARTLLYNYLHSNICQHKHRGDLKAAIGCIDKVLNTWDRHYAQNNIK